jgi:hypothetical protein
VRAGQTFNLQALQAEVRAELAVRRMSQAQGAEVAKASRTYFNRALNTKRHSDTLLAVLNGFLRNVTGYVVEPEVTYRARRAA